MKKRCFIQLSAMGGLGTAHSLSRALVEISPALPARFSKFDDNGFAKPFRGNTVLCHTDKHSALFLSMLKLQVELQRHFGDSLTLLPPDSYHMTIFEMANQQDRKPGLWPSSVPLDASIDDCTRKLAALLKAEPIGFPDRVFMKVDDSRPLSLPRQSKPGSQPAFIIPLVPYTTADAEALRVFRKQLSRVSGIRAAQHDSYGFHTSMGYRVHSMSQEKYVSFEKYYKKWLAEIIQAAGKISFHSPAFCSFEDMYQFNPLVVLGK